MIDIFRNKEPASVKYILSPHQIHYFRERLLRLANIKFFTNKAYQMIFTSVLTAMDEMGYYVVKKEHLKDDSTR